MTLILRKHRRSCCLRIGGRQAWALQCDHNRRFSIRRIHCCSMDPREEFGSDHCIWCSIWLCIRRIHPTCPFCDRANLRYSGNRHAYRHGVFYPSLWRTVRITNRRCTHRQDERELSRSTTVLRSLHVGQRLVLWCGQICSSWPSNDEGLT